MKFTFLTRPLDKTARKIEAEIRRSGMFDTQFYLEKNADVAISGMDPLAHFVKHGAREGRDPNPYFNVSRYLKSFPEVARSGLNPLLHYIRHGYLQRQVVSSPPPEYIGEEDGVIDEIRSSGLFDDKFYAEHYPDVAASGMDLLVHFIRHGVNEGRDPSPHFSVSYYLKSYTDVARNGVNPLLHYIRQGRLEGRLPTCPDAPQPRILHHLQPLKTLYDSYPTIYPVSSHTAQTLAKTLRELLADRLDFVVSLSHDNYLESVGGVQICLCDEQRWFNENRIGYVHIFPTNARPTLARPEEEFYVSMNCDGQWLAACPADTALEALGILLADTPRKVPPPVILHHLLGFNIRWVRDLLREAGANKAIFWLHDFFSLCPSYSLMRNNITFCNAPSLESNSCQICVYGEERVSHLRELEYFFRGLDVRFVAPSESARQLWLRGVGSSSARVVIAPHCRIDPDNSRGLSHKRTNRSPMKVAFLGSQLYQKGWDTWKTILAKFGSNAGYSFFHFAVQTDGSLPHTFVPVATSIANRQAMVEALRTHEIDIALLWPLGPETFSFTLHEAMAAGCYVVTNTISGNICQTILGMNRGIVLEREEELIEWFTSERLAMALLEFQDRDDRFGRLVPTPGARGFFSETVMETNP